MSTFKAIFIDESGEGSPHNNKGNIWVSVGICVDMSTHDELSIQFQSLKRDCMRMYEKMELKGSGVSRNKLKDGVTTDDIARRIAELIDEFNLKVWITSTCNNPEMPTGMFIPSNPSKGVLPKDIARELLMERISGYAKHTGDDRYIIIWDLSDTQELDDFSKLIEEYVNPHNMKKLCPKIILNILGGLSHEWPELQICDVIANFALNYIADGKFEDCIKEKSDAFKNHIYHRLMRSTKGINGVGWKRYDV